jgi:DNA-binding NarL/FixJ family response regulator
VVDRTGRQADASEQIRVVVVDDHVAVRLGLAGSLGRLPSTAGLRVVAQARTTADLKRVLKENACDVIVLDLILDDASDPAETVAELVASDYRVLVYSIADNPRLIRRALAAGAHGLSRKSESLAETAEKIRQVAHGQTLVSTEILAMIDGDQAFVEARLSNREREVLTLYVSGIDVPQIARRLFITENSAKEYLRRIRTKYSEISRPAPSKVDLLRRAIEDGVVPPIQPQ